MGRIRFIGNDPPPRGPAIQPNRPAPPPAPARADGSKAKSRSGLMPAVAALVVVVALSVAYLMFGMGGESGGSADLTGYDSKLAERYGEYLYSCRGRSATGDTNDKRRPACRGFVSELPDARAVAEKLNLIVFYRNVGDKVRAEQEARALLMSMPYDSANPLFAALERGVR